MRIADRLLTIVVTVTLTSAAWIVAGSTYFEMGDGAGETISPQPAGSPATPAAPAVHPSDVLAPGANDTLDLAVPVPSVPRDQLVDSYTDERAQGGRLHEALDIMAPAGTPIVAAAPGLVERLYLSEAGGNTIYVRSGDRRTIYYYAHLQAYAPGLHEGQQVGRGDVLGTVGATGNASADAPHLHFAMMRTSLGSQWWEPATAIDPYPMLRGK